MSTGSHRISPSCGSELGAVSEHGHGLSAADRIHFVNAENGAGGENGLVRQTVGIVTARRGCDGEGFHAGGLCRDHVHDDGARVDGLATRHIQADTLHRNPTLGNARAFSQIGVERRRHLGSGHGAGAAHGFFDGGTHFRIQLVDGGFMASTGTRRFSGRIWSNFSAKSRRAAAPRAFTSSRMGCTSSVASLVPISARGIAPAFQLGSASYHAGQ